MSVRSDKRLVWSVVAVVGAVIAVLPLLSGHSVFYFLDVPVGALLTAFAVWKIRHLRRRLAPAFTQD